MPIHFRAVTLPTPTNAVRRRRATQLAFLGLLSAMGLCGAWTFEERASGTSRQAIRLDEDAESALPVDAWTLLVTQPRSPAVVRIRFDRGVTEIIGREGAGPGEYRRPTRLHWRGGSRIGVLDRATGAAVSWARDGGRPDREPTPVLLGWSSDSFGTVIGQGGPELIPDDRRLIIRTDSIPLVRVRSGTHPDTIATVELARRAVVGPFAGIVPDFAADDRWGLLPEGAAWIARANPLRIDFLPRGESAWVLGVPLRLAPVTVEPSEHRPLAVRMTQMPPALASLAQPQWPVKADLNDAVAASDGVVWVRINQRAGAPEERYYLFSPETKLVGTRRIPRGRRVIAVGFGAVWTTSEDADGLWLVERFSSASLPE